MEKKGIQALFIGVIVIAAGLVAWYLFTQSNRLKEIQQPPVSKEKNRTVSTKVEPKAGNETARAPANATEGNRTAAAGNESGGNATAEKEKKGQEEGETYAKWLRDKVVTPYFIKDLAEFVVSSYHPAGTVDNRSENGVNAISFKALNARYGLELIGLRHSSQTLQRARDEILDHVMNPKRMQAMYKHYAGSFVQEVVEQAKDTRKEFVTEQGGTAKHSLDAMQIAEMLRLNSQYLQDVAQIFRALSKSSGITGSVRSYLQAEQQSVHANYVLSKARNEYRVLEKKKRRSGSNATLERRLSQAAREKKEAAKEYRQAIQERETLRNSIIETLRQETGPLELEGHEILYIAEWIYRRVKGEQNSRAIRTASDLIADLSAKFSRKAEEVSMESMRSS